MIKIGKTITIHSAHQLTRMPDDHPCRNLHGHSYKITIELESLKLDDCGMILDYGIIKMIVARYDHQNLNDIFGPDLPTTAEVFAMHLAGEIKSGPLKVLNDGTPANEIVTLKRVRVCETETSWAEWTP